MKVVKVCVGVDISKDSLDCCLGSCDDLGRQVYSSTSSFDNNEAGFIKLLKWAFSGLDSVDILFVMEATGVYYENLAYWLNDKGQELSVLLPNQVKHFAKSHNVKTKTDGVDAKILAKMGLERTLSKWKIPADEMRDIKMLTREYRELKRKITATKNQLHAKNSGYKCLSSITRRLKKQIRLLENHTLEIESEIRVIVMKNSQLADQIERLESIPGVGFMTIVCVLGETNAFALMKNAKQLVSYCGLDVQHKQSGNSIGKSRVSKKGNSFVRHALYMPALCAVQHNPHMKVFYERINKRKTVKKIAVTAVARKLLILIYTLWKNEAEFNPEYHVKST